MADEPNVTPEVAAPAVETPAAAPPVYFGADGTLNEGWKSTLPEGYRDEKSLPNVGDAKILAKMFVDTKRMVGRDVIAVPSDKSTEADWEAYHKAGGRPETANDYGLAVPKEFPPEFADKIFPAERLTKWQERFFKGGTSKKAANNFIADFANDMLDDIQTQQQNAQLAEDELVSGLARDWGAAYDQNIHIGNIAIEEGTGGDEDFKARVVVKIQNDPDLTRFTSNIGKKFSEGKPPSFSNIPTPSDLQSQIDEIQANPLYLKGSQKQRMDLANKIMALRAKMSVKTTA